MSKYPRYVIHNKCHGGHAVEEVDGNTYCLGLLDLKYDRGVYAEECKDCPRLVYNNQDRIAEWIAERIAERQEQEHE